MLAAELRAGIVATQQRPKLHLRQRHVPAQATGADECLRGGTNPCTVPLCRRASSPAKRGRGTAEGGGGGRRRLAAGRVASERRADAVLRGGGSPLHHAAHGPPPPVSRGEDIRPRRHPSSGSISVSTRSASRSAASVMPAARAAWARASRPLAVGERSTQGVGEPLGGEIGLLHHQSRAGLLEQGGVGRLVLVERVRERHQDRRAADHGELGDGGGAGAGR